VDGAPDRGRDPTTGRGDAVEAVLDALAAAAPAVRAAAAEGCSPEGDRASAGENPSGQERMAADARADRVLADRLLAVDGVDVYASEERESPVGSEDGGSGGPAAVDAGRGLAVAVDPLDGSANLASNNAVGTVLGVYDAVPPAPGRSLVAAAAVVYGPLTTMVADVAQVLARHGVTRIRRSPIARKGSCGTVTGPLRPPTWSSRRADARRTATARYSTGTPAVSTPGPRSGWERPPASNARRRR